MSPAEKAALAARCLAVYAEHLPHFDIADLAHEAERAESLPKSPVGDGIRRLIDDEISARIGAPA